MPQQRRAEEPVVTDGLLRALLRAQHPDLAGLPLGERVQGWDNTVARLGEHLALRLPRHAVGQTLLDREVEWLPVLAALTGGPGAGPGTPWIPTPARTGVPGAGYPFRWAVVPWVHGRPAVHAPGETRDAYAADLAHTLRGLHRPAVTGAPDPTLRGTSILDLADRFHARLGDLAGDLGEVRRRRLTVVFNAALGAPPHSGPRLWLHGDPHPNNTILSPAGPVLVDYGDLCAGDTASDLGAALTHFTAAGREVFRRAYDAGEAASAGRSARWTRAAAWSAYFALVFAAQPELDLLRPVGRELLFAPADGFPA